CWDLYARMAAYYAEHPESQKWRLDTLHRIERGEGDTAKLAALIARAIVQRHIQTMLRLDIEYDLLPKESDIIRLHFWERAFELLKKSDAVVYETEGKHKGCWVMKLAESEEFEGMAEPDKILVRSNGTVTYTAKALGMDVAEADSDRAYVEMSGRKGLGVKADDLLDTLERKATEAVREGMKAEGLSDEEMRILGRQVAIAALRYFMLKYGRNKVIAFDFAEALTFEGDSGPYLQYSTVR